ncbi:MAG: hypothetical protein M3419_00180 [Actinomycetota bacterium]|nr:hypothetical protein [Actinomycetota bacterium]
MMRSCRRLLAATVIAVSLAGCSDDTGGDPAPPQSRQAEQGSAARDSPPPGSAQLPQDEGGPLIALPDCEEPPQPVEADVPGLIVPDGAVVTSVQEDGPLVSVEGYVEQTPIEVRIFYQERPGLELFEIEDEIFEAEALYGEGEFRSYAKAQATCKTGSTLLVVVGPAGSAGQPEVGGG